MARTRERKVREAHEELISRKLSRVFLQHQCPRARACGPCLLIASKQARKQVRVLSETRGQGLGCDGALRARYESERDGGEPDVAVHFRFVLARCITLVRAALASPLDMRQSPKQKEGRVGACRWGHVPWDREGVA